MSEVKTNNKTQKPVILKMDHVTMQFGGLTAVDDFDNVAYEGEILGIIGPNGAGKTTAFNVITGIYFPTKGRIIFEDIDITPYRPHQITHLGIARTFQNIRLFGTLTVLDNVLVAMHHLLSTRDADAILKKHGKEPKIKGHLWFWRAVSKIGYKNQEQAMREKAMQLLKKVELDHLADEIASSLPYGQQRKLEIARALATEPRLLLLDEPAAGMNPKESEELMEFIKYIRDEFKLTIILIEHDMKVVMGICERIIVMDSGKIIAEGTPEEISRNPRVIEAYLGKEWEHAGA
ncbi:MAG: ABC transporter ATP-binding protein [Fervidobacterium sp.]|uniref:Amino acid/amide ABC transporter ATP-binding protein 1, HAAT family n=1 Tax=Fervidobacterium gondwanense DSM 13020 TaxID=1121883 RepID=A0A1M7T6Z5_FERGO|nr:ABC transporter ATP-binding protein [Fervidobacterium gondwanense]UXF01833.1 leucine/isoleucine/valine transporter ATP-binding subunit [Fervidobacterium riparium]SHN66493.1 amino acid/amide ABC transporter ATP-binding protein 1, HAAT family [Fervidobacterium gondwanense DSM 13020]